MYNFVQCERNRRLTTFLGRSKTLYYSLCKNKNTIYYRVRINPFSDISISNKRFSIIKKDTKNIVNLTAKCEEQYIKTNYSEYLKQFALKWKAVN